MRMRDASIRLELWLDGDSIYACSVGEVESDVNVAGTLGGKGDAAGDKKSCDSVRSDDREYLKYCLRN